MIISIYLDQGGEQEQPIRGGDSRGEGGEEEAGGGEEGEAAGLQGQGQALPGGEGVDRSVHSHPQTPYFFKPCEQ